MKLASSGKTPPTSTPSGCALGGLDALGNISSGHSLGVEPLFFHHLCKAAGFARKQVAYRLRVSKTLVDQWMSGEKHDPLMRARITCAMFAGARRHDLVVEALTFIAGGNFEGSVLTAEQTEALRQLSKAVPAAKDDNDPH